MHTIVKLALEERIAVGAREERQHEGAALGNNFTGIAL